MCHSVAKTQCSFVLIKKLLAGCTSGVFASYQAILMHINYNFDLSVSLAVSEMLNCSLESPLFK